MAKPKSKQSKKQREARRAYMRNWYWAHREKQLAYQRAYRRAHSAGHAEERRGVREYAIELVRGGMPRKAVAKEMGVHVETVRRWCRKAGLRKPVPRLRCLDESKDGEVGRTRRKYLAWCLRPSVVAECVKSVHEKLRQEEEGNRYYH